MFRSIKYIIILFFIVSISVKGQHSYDLYGNLPITFNERFRLNTFEGNTLNYNTIRDWELSLVMGYQFENTGNQNLHLLSIGKRLGKHYLYARFTPGFQKDFNYSTGSVINNSDTSQITSTLNTNLHYEETFGFGYSYNYSENLSLGLSLRYFQQQFTTDQIAPFFSDTLNYIGIETTKEERNFLRADIGIAYKPYKNLLFEVSSANLLIASKFGVDSTGAAMKNYKAAILRTEFNPTDNFSLYGIYESRGSAIAGLSYSLPIFDGDLSIGFSAAHDYLANKFLSSISPALNFSNELFSVTLVGVKNFRSQEYLTVNYFLENGIENLSNNIYEGDRVLLGINFSLSFLPEKVVEIKEAEVLTDIFPAFQDEYQTKPVAKAIVKNVSDKEVTVQPVSYILDFNTEEIYSPKVRIKPGEIKEVYFYTIVPERTGKIEKRFITQIRMKLFAKNSEPDAEIQKPILINDSNAWDGKVSNLRYYVTKDFSYSQQVAKEILKNYKTEIESSDKKIGTFLRTKILFNHFAKDILYVSDPRSVTDRVQYPNETLKLKGGDCDDLSTAFASLLESIGIQTAFVDYKSESGISHVNLLVNTKLKPQEAALITSNDNKYILRKNSAGVDEIWIPLELTLLTNFEDSWNSAAEKFQKEAIQNFGLAKGKVAIIDIY